MYEVQADVIKRMNPEETEKLLNETAFLLQNAHADQQVICEPSRFKQFLHVITGKKGAAQRQITLDYYEALSKVVQIQQIIHSDIGDLYLQIAEVSDEVSFMRDLILRLAQNQLQMMQDMDRNKIGEYKVLIMRLNAALLSYYKRCILNSQAKALPNPSLQAPISPKGTILPTESKAQPDNNRIKAFVVKMRSIVESALDRYVTQYHIIKSDVVQYTREEIKARESQFRTAGYLLFSGPLRYIGSETLNQEGDLLFEYDMMLIGIRHPLPPVHEGFLQKKRYRYIIIHETILYGQIRSIDFGWKNELVITVKKDGGTEESIRIDGTLCPIDLEVLRDVLLLIIDQMNHAGLPTAFGK